MSLKKGDVVTINNTPYRGIVLAHVEELDLWVVDLGSRLTSVTVEPTNQSGGFFNTDKNVFVSRMLVSDDNVTVVGSVRKAKPKVEFTDDELGIIHRLAWEQIDRNRKAGKPDRGDESNPLFEIAWRTPESCDE